MTAKRVVQKLLTGIGSLLVAIALWAYVVTVVGPEYTQTYRDVPVVFQGASVLEERGLMLLMEKTPTVDLELSGNRLELQKLSTSNISVTIDLSKIYDPGRTAYRYDVSYPGNVANDAITVQSKTPTGITLEIVKKISRDVPVQVSFTGNLSSDFMKEKPELETETVRISGPEYAVEQIDCARIDIALSEEQKTTITGDFAYTLCDKDGQIVDTQFLTVVNENEQTVFVTVPIKRVKEIPLTVTLIEGGGATAANSSVVIAPESIFVSGSEEALSGLTQINLGTVDLSTIMEATQLTFTIATPENVVNETGVTEATVDVSFPELTTKEFRVTAFEAVNVPRGMKATFSTKELVVTLRGSKRLVESLVADDIKVTVDFAGVEVGNQRLDAVVTVEAEGNEVGAIGTYSVLALVEADNDQ